MSDFAVKVVKITDIIPHPNADRLEIAQIAGWQCIIQKGSYEKGSLAVYIPIDSVLPAKLEDKLFGTDAKIKLSKSRVRTIKIRGSISQGMLVACGEVGVLAKEGYDCTSKLGITKYEPPAPPASMDGGHQVSNKKRNPHFKEYGGLDNFKHYPDLFQPGEEVVITEKIHGTNFRFGWVPVHANSLWKKFKKLLGMLPEYEFVFGSNKVQLQNKRYSGYYDKLGTGNVYEEAVRLYNLKDRTNKHLLRGYIFYGEIYGSSIQKNYLYGCKDGERRLVIFDVMCSGMPSAQTTGGIMDVNGFLDCSEVQDVCSDIQLDVVPILYKGPYDAVGAKALTLGNSVLEPTQKVREGVVIKSITETKCHIGRKILKLISDQYLLNDDNTDFH